MRLLTLALAVLLSAAAWAQDRQEGRDTDALPPGAVLRLGTSRFRQGENVTCVEFLGDGRRLATGGEHRFIHLWDVATGQALRTLKGHSAGIEGLDFSANGRTLLSEAGDVTARLWEQ